MALIEALVIGLIQGITEWLPISSEGITSLVLTQFFGRSLADAVVYSLWLHLGTLLAATVYFRKDLKKLIKNVPSYCKQVKAENETNNLTSFIVIATLFTVIIGGPLFFLGIDKLNIQGKYAMAFIGVFLIITGLIQRVIKKTELTKKVLLGDGILTGIVQGLAIIPGISRSGITTFALLFRKYDSNTALRLSFLLSVPAVLIAVIGILLFSKITLNAYAWLAVLTSFIIGLGTINIMFKIAKRMNFGWFCLILGLLSVLAAFV